MENYIYTYINVLYRGLFEYENKILLLVQKVQLWK